MVELASPKSSDSKISGRGCMCPSGFSLFPKQTDPKVISLRLRKIWFSCDECSYFYRNGFDVNIQSALFEC